MVHSSYTCTRMNQDIIITKWHGSGTTYFMDDLNLRVWVCCPYYMEVHYINVKQIYGGQRTVAFNAGCDMWPDQVEWVTCCPWSNRSCGCTAIRNWKSHVICQCNFLLQSCFNYMTKQWDTKGIACMYSDMMFGNKILAVTPGLPKDLKKKLDESRNHVLSALTHSACLIRSLCSVIIYIIGPIRFLAYWFDKIVASFLEIVLWSFSQHKNVS